MKNAIPLLQSFDEGLTLNDRITEGESISLETVRKRKDGTLIDVAFTGKPIRIRGGGEKGYGIYQDISDRKRTEKEVENLLREKDLLLREVHHRVKNNMSTIASLLSLQAGSTTEKQVAAGLLDARARIQSMMMVYEALFRSEDFRSASAADYLDSLISTVADSHPGSENVIIERNFGEFLMDAKQLFPLGIITNELLTNSFKYAFPDNGKGVIRISLKPVSKETLRFEFRDDGAGIPDGTSASPEGFGLGLVRLLAEQLGGTVESENSRGTVFRIEFPV